MRIDQFNKIYGALWGLVFTGNTALLYDDTKNYIRAKTQSAQTKVTEAKKRLFLDTMSFSGAGAFSIDWAHSVSWIRLGKALPFVSGWGHMATLTVSGAEAYRGIQKLYTSLFFKKKDEQSQKGLICLTIAAHISAIAWAILGVSSLVLGAIIFPKITGTLLCLYIGFSVGGTLYKMHYDVKENQSL
jgi:hypothetical protein